MRVSGSITTTVATVAETCGKWNDVWSNFDQRQKAKGANDGANAGNQPDMFGVNAAR